MIHIYAVCLYIYCVGIRTQRPSGPRGPRGPRGRYFAKEKPRFAWLLGEGEETRFAGVVVVKEDARRRAKQAIHPSRIRLV